MVQYFGNCGDHAIDWLFTGLINHFEFGAKVVKDHSLKCIRGDKKLKDYPKRPRVSAIINLMPFLCVISLISICFARVVSVKTIA